MCINTGVDYIFLKGENAKGVYWLVACLKLVQNLV